MTGLLDLPTELLFYIYACLQRFPSKSAESIHFAGVSRRLNEIYMSLAGIATSTFNLVPTRKPTAYPQNYDDLSALIIAFSIRRADRIICRLRGGTNLIIYDCWRLYLAISRLDSLEALELDFTDTNPPYHATSNVMLRLWVNIFGGLLNEALRRGCKELDIYGGEVMTESYQMFELQDRDAFIKMLLRTWIFLKGKPGLNAKPYYYYTRLSGSRILPSTKSQPPPPLRSPYTPKSFLSTLRQKPTCNSLLSFKISSLIFLLPPFSQWLYELFQNSPHLTSLTVSDILIEPNSTWNIKDWEAAFSALRKFIPRSRPLTSLTLQRLYPQISMLTIGDFLYHLDFSRLKSLVLDGSLPIMHRLLGISLSFPRVEYFRGPPDYLLGSTLKFTSSLDTVWIMPRFGSSTVAFRAPLTPLTSALEYLKQFQCKVIGLAIDDLPPALLEGTTSYRSFKEYTIEWRYGCRYSGVTDLVLGSFEVYEERLSIIANEQGDAREIEAHGMRYLARWLSNFTDLRRVELKGRALEEQLIPVAKHFSSLLKKKKPVLESLRLGNQLYRWDSRK
ncbi:hypothetical protein AX16_009693 [Volvariella volvacea WC 439]|nr:hypothetical protein AX16_009693 [Volvariella volvacea WC 439]